MKCRSWMLAACVGLLYVAAPIPFQDQSSARRLDIFETVAWSSRWSYTHISSHVPVCRILAAVEMGHFHYQSWWCTRSQQAL